MTITLCFYHGHDAVALGTRLVTRRRGQPLADVPAHVAAVFTDEQGATLTNSVLTEAILSGIHQRVAEPADFAWSRAIDVPNPARFQAFLTAQVGHKYRIASIVLVLLRGLLQLIGLDKDIGLVDNCRTAYICSTLVYEALRAGGYPIYDRLLETGNDFMTPVRPNDLWWAVRNLPQIFPTTPNRE